MAKTYLNFIEDANLVSALQGVVSTIEETKADVDILKNSLDAFGALFECVASGADLKTWMASEKVRQAQKTLQNSIGTFHQELIGGIDNCKTHGTGGGIDIENISASWVAEVKNKFNTVKGSDRVGIYDLLKIHIARYEKTHGKNFTGYYVEVIPKKGQSYNEPFQPTDSKRGGKKRQRNEHIRIISGPAFYDLASGTKGALKKIYKVLPKVLEDEFNLKSGLTPKEMEDLFNLTFEP
jgi:hypothetical protein